MSQKHRDIQAFVFYCRSCWTFDELKMRGFQYYDHWWIVTPKQIWPTYSGAAFSSHGLLFLYLFSAWCPTAGPEGGVRNSANIHQKILKVLWYWIFAKIHFKIRTIIKVFPSECYFSYLFCSFFKLSCSWLKIQGFHLILLRWVSLKLFFDFGYEKVNCWRFFFNLICPQKVFISMWTDLNQE